jgi:hypothetical protein
MGVQEALDCLRGLEIKKGSGAFSRPRTNSHIHLPPNFSAFETVDQAVSLAARQQVTVVGVSNYYDFEVYGEFFKLARPHKIFPLFGLEIISLIHDLVKAGVKINDPGNPGKMYICGKGITRFGKKSPEAQNLIGTIRRSDTERMAKMIDKLAKVFEAGGVATGLTEEKVIEQVCRRHGCPKDSVTLQERHVAKAFQEALFEKVPADRRVEKMRAIFGAAPKAGPEEAVKIQNEIRSHLMKAGKPGFVEETFVNFDQAYRLILELGGIPCYPTLADGNSPMCAFEDPVEKLIAAMKDRRIYCAEYIPLRNKPEVLSHYVKAVRKAGIPVLGGTEHNTLDLLPIEPACVGGAAVPEEIKEIFWEGACVVAAHQWATLRGENGYVDGQGNLNPAYTSDEERIKAFAQIGSAVIKTYQE